MHECLTFADSFFRSATEEIHHEPFSIFVRLYYEHSIRAFCFLFNPSVSQIYTHSNLIAIFGFLIEQAFCMTTKEIGSHFTYIYYMPKFPKGFGRRKSTANAFEDGTEAPVEHSFKVFERPDSGSKSFDGGAKLGKTAIAAPGRRPLSHLDDDNMFENIGSNR
ncbi:uncharacterized protein LY89DRAFT_298339 [Mollisia scopiformis]|uniref:Uncharacterized protein n=1 Tax=Mollisia scopiformis TaxID=149040 RepID=A0A194XQ78_MOLSC|nr:uncharacterized protein LY89DRAFT_298339 [Mollisia scopiformis]KUJ22415.1 hypothetical protein LY89DRAFT_298339 [Mollisia scopiformis]